MSGQDCSEPDSATLELGSLREYFAGRLPDRLREVEEAWQRVAESAWSEPALKDFHRFAHSLCGAGATFGFPSLTTAARTLEQHLKAVLRGLKPPLEADVVEGLLASLRQASTEEPPPPLL
jgi:HPt (histidine-containing phosphotransfer) domain-containing protein